MLIVGRKKKEVVLRNAIKNISYGDKDFIECMKAIIRAKLAEK